MFRIKVGINPADSEVHYIREDGESFRLRGVKGARVDVDVANDTQPVYVTLQVYSGFEIEVADHEVRWDQIELPGIREIPEF